MAVMEKGPSVTLCLAPPICVHLSNHLVGGNLLRNCTAKGKSHLCRRLVRHVTALSIFLRRRFMELPWKWGGRGGNWGLSLTKRESTARGKGVGVGRIMGKGVEIGCKFKCKLGRWMLNEITELLHQSRLKL